MQPYEFWFEQDLNKPITTQYNESLAFTADNLSPVVGVRLTMGGTSVTVSGNVACTVIRQDGSTVTFTGTASGNAVSAALPGACFAVPGQIAVMLQVVDGDTKTTVLRAVLNVTPSSSGTPIDPGSAVPDLAELLAKVDACDDAAAAANSAASAAESAAGAWAGISAEKIMRCGFSFTEGKGINSSGEIFTNSSAAKRIATEGFTDISDARKITYDVVSGYRIYLAYYSAASEGAYLAASGWLTGSGTITRANAWKYMRVCYASVSDASTLTVADADKASVSLDYRLLRDVQHIINMDAEPAYLEAGSFESGGITEAGGSTTNANRIRTQGFVDVSGYDSVIYAVDDGYRIGVCFYSAQSGNDFIENSLWLTGSGRYYFPDGTKYLRMQFASLADATALTTDDYDVAAISFGLRVSDRPPEIVTRTKWLAVGDSLTFGVYSTGPSTEVTNKYGWVQRLARALNYDLKVMASRGIGYNVTGVDPLNSSADRINLSTLLSRCVALEDEFNLITVALGVNDYNTSSSTLADLPGAVTTAITTLATRWPNARLVFITPFNCCNKGSAAVKYAYGYTYPTTGDAGKTLKQVADTIAGACEACGVECIYASDGFLMNTINITALLPDGVHPSYIAHTLIAKNMAHYLTY